MDYPTLATVAENKIREQYRLLYNVLVVLTGSFLIAAMAQVEIRLPFSPVPITGQTFAVLVVAMALGAVRGGIVVLTYLIEGCAGLPVFSGGAAGIAHLFGPTGGYLIGFLAGSVLVGFLAERGWDRNIVLTSIAMYFATIIIFCVGLCWLSVFVPTDQVYALGLWPFIPGAVIQIGVAALLLPTLRKFV
jgi:biotin transport system substrate-specific component